MPRIHRFTPERPRPLLHLCRLLGLFNMSEPAESAGEERLILNEPPPQPNRLRRRVLPEHRPAPLQALGPGRARLAIIVKTVPEDLRTTAFSVHGLPGSILSIVGPPLAAPLLFTAGVMWALAINAISFLASSILLGRKVWDSRRRRPVTKDSGTH